MGCVSVAIPVVGLMVVVTVAAAVTETLLVRSGWLDSRSIWRLAFRVTPLLLLAPSVLLCWQLPVLRERLQNRRRRCAACGACEWEIGERGLGL
ncbi:MAG: hypothetical protein ACO1SX_20115 [Actinomycetota bacterium]